MTIDRPYRGGLKWDAALSELEQKAGSHFDPNVVDALIACEPDLRAVHAETVVTTA
jgi:HD-GYP domain-containing protein (c-di-GMP phosphodiesterase class II)